MMSELLTDKRGGFHVIYGKNGVLHLAFTEEDRQKTLEKIRGEEEDERKQ